LYREAILQIQACLLNLLTSPYVANPTIINFSLGSGGLPIEEAIDEDTSGVNLVAAQASCGLQILKVGLDMGV